MKAAILAGGLGTRLRTLVNDRPKPMASVNDKPFLEYQVEFLRKYHIKDIVFCIGFMADHVRDYFKDGHPWGVNICYAIEEPLLGTGGAIKNAEAYLEETPFLVLNGDSFFGINLSEFVRFHQAKKVQSAGLVGTVALTKVQDMSSFGAVLLDAQQGISTFKEKSKELNYPGLINAGIYLLEPKILRLIPPAKKISLEKEVFPTLLEKDYHLAGYPSSGYFVDIGTPEGYHKFQCYIQGSFK